MLSSRQYFHQELANYGEYSGAPSEQMTYNYAKTILGLMTRVKDDRGKVRLPRSYVGFKRKLARGLCLGPKCLSLLSSGMTSMNGHMLLK